MQKIKLYEGEYETLLSRIKDKGAEDALAPFFEVVKPFKETEWNSCCVLPNPSKCYICMLRVKNAKHTDPAQIVDTYRIAYYQPVDCTWRDAMNRPLTYIQNFPELWEYKIIE